MMLTKRRWRSYIRIFNGLLIAVMVLSITVVGLAQQQADETTTTGVYLPFLIRDAIYKESIGVLDTSFSQDGWLLTNYSGSLDDGYAIVIQPDGKLVMAGSFDGTSRDFGLARFNSDGSEDMTFDEDGRVHTDFFDNNDKANAIALQADGKIVVAGSAYKNSTTKDEFALARYNSDGSMDNSFDGDGLVTTDFLGAADYASAVAIQNDGKIVVAGYAYDEVNHDYEFALARYTSMGALDSTFGVGGKVITDFSSESDYAYALTLSGDKVIVVGAARSGDYEFAVARYNANGTLDTTFDSDGKLVTDFYGFEDRARAVVLQPDGKLVIAGYSKDVYSNDFALARYNANGSLDTTFGAGGKVVTDIYGGDDYVYGLILEPGSCNLVVGGYILNGTQNDLALARYTSNGTLDNSFDGDGKVVVDFDGRSEWGYGLARQVDGRLVLAGNLLTVAGSDFAMARFNTDGTLDTNFNEDGWVITNLFGSSDQGLAAVVQPDDKLVVAGWVEGMYDTDFAVARYFSNGSPDLSFDDDGRVVTDINGDYDYAYAMVIQTDGKIVVGGAANNGWDDDFALVRYNLDGSLDETFDGDGRVINDYATGDDSIHAVLIQEDGKLVVAGEVATANGQDFALARYNTDGSLDTSFGINGWVVTDFFGDDDHGRALAQQPDGKLLVAGYATNGAEYDFALARYSASGSLDPTFDGDGRVVTDINADDQGHAITISGDGTILVAGWSYNGTNDDFALVRYNPNGSLDNSFDGDGRVVTNISGNDERLTSIGLQPNGKIMVAGRIYTTTDSGYDFALARYLTNGSLDPGFSTDGWLTLDFYAGDDSGQALLMQPNGKIVLAGFADNGTDYDFALARYR